MKIAAHITYFFVEQRLVYLQQVIDDLSKMPHDVDIYIYCNKKDLKQMLKPSNKIFYKTFPYRKSGMLGYNNGLWNKLGLTILVHPFHLSWENRKVVEGLIETYDVQIYLEDDINFTSENFNYWLAHKDICLNADYNLGFLRFEYDTTNHEKRLADIAIVPQNKISINDQLFLVNDINPYCGFWIYDRKELMEFIKSEEWKFKFKMYSIREKSAIGWHGTEMNRYKATILPIIQYQQDTYLLPRDSMIHHLPNTYITNPVISKVKLMEMADGDYKLEIKQDDHIDAVKLKN
jgi:hypothetical protein